MEVVDLIQKFGFPTVMVIGLGYFVYYVWKWVTTEINPVVGEASKTLITLVDKVRMLDNDMIRLNTKLTKVLEYRSKLNPKRQEELQRIVDDCNKSRATVFVKQLGKGHDPKNSKGGDIETWPETIRVRQYPI